MYIEDRLFSETTEETLYSVLMDEDEYALYSEFQKEFGLKQKILEAAKEAGDKLVKKLPKVGKKKSVKEVVPEWKKTGSKIDSKNPKKNLKDTALIEEFLNRDYNKALKNASDPVSRSYMKKLMRSARDNAHPVYTTRTGKVVDFNAKNAKEGGFTKWYPKDRVSTPGGFYGRLENEAKGERISKIRRDLDLPYFGFKGIDPAKKFKVEPFYK